MNLQKRICIIGAGAIGGLTAAVLARENYQVQLVTKHKALAEKISNTGISVSGFCGDFNCKIPSVAKPDELEGIFDFILIATKATDLAAVARGMLPYMDEHSRVVSMQNGICEDELAAVVGMERTIGCVVGWGGTMHEHGKVEMTSGGEFIIGNWKRAEDHQLTALKGILDHIIPTRVSNEILSELYSKLIINSCITTLGVVSGQFLGDMLAARKVRELFISVIREGILVANAMKLMVAPAANGKLNYYKFLSPGLFSGFRRHLFIRVIGIKYRKLKSSSLQSLERGAKTEVDNYNGYISARGIEFDVETPVNDILTRMVHEIENGSRNITPDNFNEIKIT